MKSNTLIIAIFCVLTIACLVLAQTWGQKSMFIAVSGYILAMLFSTLALTAAYASRASSDDRNQQQSSRRG